MIAVVDGGVPVDKFVIDDGFGDVSGQRNFLVGLDFVEELAHGFDFRLIGVRLRAALGAEEGVVANGDRFFHGVGPLPRSGFSTRRRYDTHRMTSSRVDPLRSVGGPVLARILQLEPDVFEGVVIVGAL